MSSCIVIIDHSFRINSRIMKKAIQNHKEIAVIYPSPWYWSKELRDVFKKGDVSFFIKSINYFASELKKELGLDLYLIKSNNPASIISDACKEFNVDKVYYDMPLFGKSSWLDLDGLDCEIIDSDSHDPQCTKMTAKSRWVYWSKNRIKYSEPEYNSKINLELDLNKYIPDEDKYTEILTDIANIYKRLLDIIPSYYETRNKRDGSTKLSKYLHHGLIDANQIISGILDIVPGFIEKDNPVVPFLRQMAFREISIRKVRTRNLYIGLPLEDWLTACIDQKSVDHLLIEKEQKFTEAQLFESKTGDELLDREIKRLKSDGWLPNRSRMWISGEVYYGMGGGLKSLKALIKLFDKYSDDGQSPNNYISCIEAMRLQYGKVMKYNRDRTFKLLDN